MTAVAMALSNLDDPPAVGWVASRACAGKSGSDEFTTTRLE
jgi:hypothetical protein